MTTPAFAESDDQDECYLPISPERARTQAERNRRILAEAARRLARHPDPRTIAGAMAIAARHLSPASMIMHKGQPDMNGTGWACMVCGLAVAHHAKPWRLFLWRLTRGRWEWS